MYIAVKSIYGWKKAKSSCLVRQIITTIGFIRSNANHSVFVRKESSGIVIVDVYVDDILISRSDIVRIVDVKK